jgi:hypothetical protein
MLLAPSALRGAALLSLHIFDKGLSRAAVDNTSAGQRGFGTLAQDGRYVLLFEFRDSVDLMS